MSKKESPHPPTSVAVHLTQVASWIRRAMVSSVMDGRSSSSGPVLHLHILSSFIREYDHWECEPPIEATGDGRVTLWAAMLVGGGEGVLAGSPSIYVGEVAGGGAAAVGHAMIESLTQVLASGHAAFGFSVRLHRRLYTPPENWVSPPNDHFKLRPWRMVSEELNTFVATLALNMATQTEISDIFRTGHWPSAVFRGTSLEYLASSFQEMSPVFEDVIGILAEHDLSVFPHDSDENESAYGLLSGAFRSICGLWDALNDNPSRPFPLTYACKNEAGLVVVDKIPAATDLLFSICRGDTHFPVGCYLSLNSMSRTYRLPFIYLLPWGELDSVGLSDVFAASFDVRIKPQSANGPFFFNGESLSKAGGISADFAYTYWYVFDALAKLKGVLSFISGRMPGSLVSQVILGRYLASSDGSDDDADTDAVVPVASLINDSEIDSLLHRRTSVLAGGANGLSLQVREYLALTPSWGSLSFQSGKAGAEPLFKGNVVSWFEACGVLQNEGFISALLDHGQDAGAFTLSVLSAAVTNRQGAWMLLQSPEFLRAASYFLTSHSTLKLLVPASQLPHYAAGCLAAAGYAANICFPKIPRSSLTRAGSPSGTSGVYHSWAAIAPPVEDMDEEDLALADPFETDKGCVATLYAYIEVGGPEVAAKALHILSNECVLTRGELANHLMPKVEDVTPPNKCSLLDLLVLLGTGDHDETYAGDLVETILKDGIPYGSMPGVLRALATDFHSVTLTDICMAHLPPSNHTLSVELVHGVLGCGEEDLQLLLINPLSPDFVAPLCAHLRACPYRLDPSTAGMVLRMLAEGVLHHNLLEYVLAYEGIAKSVAADVLLKKGPLATLISESLTASSFVNVSALAAGISIGDESAAHPSQLCRLIACALTVQSHANCLPTSRLGGLDRYKTVMPQVAELFGITNEQALAFAPTIPDFRHLPGSVIAWPSGAGCYDWDTCHLPSTVELYSFAASVAWAAAPCMSRHLMDLVVPTPTHTVGAHELSVRKEDTVYKSFFEESISTLYALRQMWLSGNSPGVDHCRLIARRTLTPLHNHINGCHDFVAEDMTLVLSKSFSLPFVWLLFSSGQFDQILVLHPEGGTAYLDMYGLRRALSSGFSGVVSDKVMDQALASLGEEGHTFLCINPLTLKGYCKRQGTGRLMKMVDGDRAIRAALGLD